MWHCKTIKTPLWTFFATLASGRSSPSRVGQNSLRFEPRTHWLLDIAIFWTTSKNTQNSFFSSWNTKYIKPYNIKQCNLFLVCCASNLRWQSENGSRRILCRTVVAGQNYISGVAYFMDHMGWSETSTVENRDRRLINKYNMTSIIFNSTAFLFW